MMTKTFFVSGHMDLTKEEFAQHYEHRIRAAHAAGASFVVGFDVQLTHHHMHQTRRAARRDPQPDYAVLQVAPGFRGFRQR